MLPAPKELCDVDPKNQNLEYMLDGQKCSPRLPGYINRSEANRPYVPKKQEIHGFYPKGLARTKPG